MRSGPRRFRSLWFAVVASLSGLTTLTERSADAAPSLSPKSDTLVADLLLAAGASTPAHRVSATPSGIEAGRALVHVGRISGFAGSDGAPLGSIFKCVDCHNTVREDPDLRVVDPEARLAFAEENKIPFLQGAPLYGVVNRESWYCDEWGKKYGESLVGPARKDLRAAIQLCAEHCAQGRRLSEGELQAVLEYLQSIGLRFGDLGLTPAEQADLVGALVDPTRHAEAREFLRSRYLPAAPAHFAPPEKAALIPATGEPGRGAALLDRSCMHCHGERGLSNLRLAPDGASGRKLAKLFNKPAGKNLADLLRTGIPPRPPQKRVFTHDYTLERLSPRQLSGLRAWAAQFTPPAGASPADDVGDDEQED